MTCIAVRAALAVLVAAATSSVAAQTAVGLRAVRAQAPVEIERDGRWQDAQAIGPVQDGERLRTGGGGRLLLRLSAGRIAIGGDTLLRVHGIEAPDPPARLELARLVLERGVVRLDSTRGEQPSAADLRLNLGELRLRVFGAEVWAESTPAGEEICLVRGAVEVLTADGTERLDQAGDCLRAGSLGLRRLDAAAAGPLATRLARVAFADDLPVPAASAAVADAGPGVDGAATAGSATTDAVLAPPAVPLAESGRWCLVLASLPTRAGAETEAARLFARGYEVLIEPGERKGRTVYRLTFGAFETRQDAQRALQAQRTDPAFAGAWPLQRP